MIKSIFEYFVKPYTAEYEHCGAIGCYNRLWNVLALLTLVVFVLGLCMRSVAIFIVFVSIAIINIIQSIIVNTKYPEHRRYLIHKLEKENNE